MISKSHMIESYYIFRLSRDFPAVSLHNKSLETHSELEWTIIFGLNCTKIYGGHMSSTDF